MHVLKRASVAKELFLCDCKEHDCHSLKYVVDPEILVVISIMTIEM